MYIKFIFIAEFNSSACVYLCRLSNDEINIQENNKNSKTIIADEYQIR